MNHLIRIILIFLITWQSAFATSYGVNLGAGGEGGGAPGYTNVGSFPVTASDGDQAIDLSTGSLYVYTSGSWQLIGSPTVVAAIGAINGQPKNAQGGAVVGNTIYLQSADSLWPGLLTAADWSTFNSKEPAISAGTTAQYWRGDKSWQTLNGAAVANTPAGNIAATDVQAALNELDSEKIASTEKGANNGVATLDAGGKIPTSQLPNSVMEYQGVWNANTNTPALADGVGNTGDVYRVSVAGSTDFGSGAISFVIGDYAIYNGSVWEKAHAGADTVVSVNGQAGVVVLDAGDIGNTPAGNVAATDVQAAINELDTEKQATGTTWLLGGNAGTTPGTHYVGTSDSQDLQIRTNNATRLIAESGGKVYGLQARDIADNTTESTYEFGANFNPSGAKTAAFARGLAGYMSYDQPNAGYSNTGGASAVYGRLEHNGSGTLGYASVFDGSIYFGANGGTTSLYKGLNLDHGIDNGASITSYYGISNTANIGTADINNLQIANLSVGATDLTSNGVNGLNVNPNISGTSVISGNLYGGGFYATLDTTASVTGGMYGLQISPQVSDSATVTNSLIGLDLNPVVGDTATVNDFVGLNLTQNVNGTATVTNGMVGARISMAATPDQTSAKGLEINMNGVDLSPAALAGGAHKYGLDIQDGSLKVGYDYTVPGASGFFQDHYIGGATNVASGDPTAAFGFGINLAQTVNFQDDWSTDPSGLGFNAVGFVGLIQGAVGKTMYSWTGALGGAGNPAGAGTLTNAYMFKAAGILPQGGSLAVTNQYGFHVDPTLFCSVGTNCWGFFEDGSATVENHMSKLAIGTASKKVGNSSTALEIGNSKGFVNGSGTTATKNALTAVAGMQFYDTTLNKLQWYNGSAWVDAASAAAPTDIQEAPAGSINNSNTAFTLSQTPTSNAAVQLYKNGRLLIQGTDYTIAGVNITMTVAPDFAELLRAVYRY